MSCRVVLCRVDGIADAACDPDDDVVLVLSLARSLAPLCTHRSHNLSNVQHVARVSASEERMREERKNVTNVSVFLDARSLFVFPVGIRVR